MDTGGSQAIILGTELIRTKEIMECVSTTIAAPSAGVGGDNYVSIIFEYGAVHFRDFVASSGAQGSGQFMMRQFFPHQNFFIQPAVVNEDFGATFNKSFHFLVSIGGETDQVVDEHERASREDTGEDGVVPAVHGILHGVAENQQQDEVERRKLADLPFAGHSQEHDQASIDDKRADDEFPPQQRKLQHAQHTP